MELNLQDAVFGFVFLPIIVEIAEFWPVLTVLSEQEHVYMFTHACHNHVISKMIMHFLVNSLKSC